MKRLLFCAPLLFFAMAAQSLEIGAFNLVGHASAGYNQAQGSYGSLGADFYYRIDDNLSAGVGGYYAAGAHPSLDREIGVGPFVSYAYPLLNFLVASIREDLDYVDQRDAVIYHGSTVAKSEYGMASITSVGLHVFLTRNFGVAAGYRFALGLNNSDLENDRSGVYFGLSFGI